MPGSVRRLTRISRTSGRGAQWLLAIPLLFACSLPARAQLRPETTPPPEKQPAEKKPAPARASRILIETQPNAHVYVDDAFKGEASPEGRLVVEDAKPGAHKVRVSFDGKQTFEEEVVVVTGKDASLKAVLADLPGRILVHSSPGASVYLDDALRGTTNSSGDLVLAEVPQGSHTLRVSLQGKKEYQETVLAVSGRQISATATLADTEKPGLPAGTVRTNPMDGQQYVWIPPGNFMMGCSQGDLACRDPEKPAHLAVITKGFWMGRTEVTVAAAERYARAVGLQMPPPPYYNPGWSDQNMPVVQADWNAFQAYCRWVGGRLPTEAEWEYAARAGNTSPTYAPVEEVAWYGDNSGHKRLDTTKFTGDMPTYERIMQKNGNGAHDVAQKRPNAWGLYDMLGNAAEWVQDWFAPDYYQNSPAQDPQGPPTGQLRVVRGGAWAGFPSFVRASSRNAAAPTKAVIDFGGRCVVQ